MKLFEILDHINYVKTRLDSLCHEMERNQRQYYTILNKYENDLISFFAISAFQKKYKEVEENPNQFDIVNINVYNFPLTKHSEHHGVGLKVAIRKSCENHNLLLSRIEHLNKRQDYLINRIKQVRQRLNEI